MKLGSDNSGNRAGSVIPAKLQRRAGRLLAAGATFEETLGELRRRGAKQLSLKAVQDFFRSSLEVQRERIERRRQAVEELKRALTGPVSVRRSLAEAALLTGLTELTAPGGLHRTQLNHYRLQFHTLRLKRQSATLGQRVAQTRLKLAMAHWEMARLKLADLGRKLEQELRQRHLDLPAVAEIRKIQALMGSLPIADRSRVPWTRAGSDPLLLQNDSTGGE
jgi:hypothetical protein